MIDFSQYTWLRIEPADAWFFRDGRPSNRGEDQSDIESEFPPNPATVVGALRAALARANGWNGQGSWVNQKEELKQVLGDGFDDLGQLRFLGPILCKRFDDADGEPAREELLWPLPQHVVGRYRNDGFMPQALLKPCSELVCCDVNPEGIHLPAISEGPRSSDAGEYPKPPAHPENIFVTTTGLNAILRGELPDSRECIGADRLFVHESRIGIRRDPDTRATGGGDIYSPRYIRLLPGVSLVEAVFGVPESWNWPTMMPLGGESRMALVEPLSSPPELPQVAASKATVAVALSPAKFDSNWWGAGPGAPASQLAADLNGRVTCVALDRPRLIGGWDFNSGPRPLSPFAPAGTVWWLSESTSDATLTQFGINTNYGYGLVAVS